MYLPQYLVRVRAAFTRTNQGGIVRKLSFVAAALAIGIIACTAADPVEEPVAESESAAKACRPDKKYVSRDANQCAAILFLCEEGREPFFDNRGCGCRCRGSANVCNDPARTYVSQDPAQCAVIRFACPEGQTYFGDDCGCGCTY
jgi:hypothetical protein